MVFLTDRIINGMRTHLLQCSTDKNDCRSCLNLLCYSCATGALWWPNVELCIDDWLQINVCYLSISMCLCIVLCSSGPISSILVNKYGSRPVMMAGGCLSGMGLIAASFCSSVQALYFCIGVVGGNFLYFLSLDMTHQFFTAYCCHLVFLKNKKTKSYFILHTLCYAQIFLFQLFYIYRIRCTYTITVLIYSFRFRIGLQP